MTQQQLQETAQKAADEIHPEYSDEWFNVSVLPNIIDEASLSTFRKFYEDATKTRQKLTAIIARHFESVETVSETVRDAIGTIEDALESCRHHHGNHPMNDTWWFDWEIVEKAKSELKNLSALTSAASQPASREYYVDPKRIAANQVKEGKMFPSTVILPACVKCGANAVNLNQCMKCGEDQPVKKPVSMEDELAEVLRDTMREYTLHGEGCACRCHAILARYDAQKGQR